MHGASVVGDLQRLYDILVNFRFRRVSRRSSLLSLHHRKGLPIGRIFDSNSDSIVGSLERN